MKLKTRILIIAYITAILMIAGSLLFGVYQSWQNRINMQKLAELVNKDAQTITVSEEIAIVANTSNGQTLLPTTTGSEPTQKPLSVLPKLQSLFLENQDLVGWIKIEDTQIDYPVMYTPFDGGYYLYRNFQKQQSKFGLPFVDPGSRIYPRSTNILIHGHHMKDGSMFAALLEYQSVTFFKKHPIIQFDTVVEEGRYEIFAAFLADVSSNNEQDFTYYKFIDADNENEFNDYIQNSLSQSLYDTGIKPEYGDQLLTLSTCSYHVDDGRMVVVARKVIDHIINGTDS
jgi:SrtB family sortase